MKEDIQGYAPADGTVAQVKGHIVVIDIGDASLSLGDAVTVGGSTGRVTEQLGARQVEVQFLGAPSVAVGESASVAGGSAGVVLPVPGTYHLADLHYSTAEDAVALSVDPPGLMEIQTGFEPISCGNATVDIVAPLGVGAVHLVIDGSGSTRVVDAAVAAARSARREAAEIRVGVEPREGAYNLVPNDAWEHLTTLRIGLAWAGALRDRGQEIIFVAELPQPENSVVMGQGDRKGRSTLGGLVDLLGAALTSRKVAPVTGFLRLGVDEATLALAETLALGSVDVQWVVDDAGIIDIARSSSNVDVAENILAERSAILGTLARAASLQDRLAIFGEDELDDAERQTLRDAESIRESLQSSRTSLV